MLAVVAKLQIFGNAYGKKYVSHIKRKHYDNNNYQCNGCVIKALQAY